MKAIIYTKPDGTAAIVRPYARERRVSQWTVGDETHFTQTQLGQVVTFDQIARAFKVSDPAALNVQWAETEDEFAQRIRRNDVPVRMAVQLEGIEPLQARADCEKNGWTYTEIESHVIEDSAIPPDRTFRNALKCVNGTLAHDMPKCQEIQKQRLRELREPKMRVLDIAYTRADEAGDLAKKREIALQKQALRDVTADPAIAAASTPEALKAVVPEILK